MKFKIFTKNDNKRIPATMFLVKNKFGWLYLENDGAQWYVNHTQDFKDCSEEENNEAIKAIVAQVKFNKKVLENQNEPTEQKEDSVHID